MTDGTKHLEELVISLKESLEREIGSLRAEMREGVERIERVTSRHSGMIVSGTVAITTLTRTITKQETAIRDLQTRVRKLEGRRKNGKRKQ